MPVLLYIAGFFFLYDALPLIVVGMVVLFILRIFYMCFLGLGEN
jgi:hypothetical protein